MVLFSKKQSDIPGRRRPVATRTERTSETSLNDRYTFKRNRTLTGSASSNVKSTSEASAQLKSPRVHAHDLARKRRHIGAILLLVVAAGAAVFSVIYQFTSSVIVKSEDISIKLDSSYNEIIESYFLLQPVERLRS